jgi:hypothetical protein
MPNAVRTGHTAAFLSLDLRKAGAKTQDPGPGAAQGGAATEQVHGWHLRKNSKSAIKLLQVVRMHGAGCSPNAKTLRFGIRNHPKHTTRELQHTAGTTSHIAQCYPLWEFAGGVWEVACCSEKPGWAHDTANTEVSGGHGPGDAGALPSRSLDRGHGLCQDRGSGDYHLVTSTAMIFFLHILRRT